MNDEEIKQATEQVITEMLTESTGKALMDSGDAYGRHWEENQKEIKKGMQPMYYCRNDKTKTVQLEPIVPIFDFLMETVEYTEECQELESLLPNLSHDMLYYMESFIGTIQNPNAPLYAFEKNEFFDSKVGNTYNYETTLSQGFEYIWFEHDGEDYIAISIHNGCDTRGGYTDIHIFKVDWAEEMWCSQSEANIYCECGMHDYRQHEPSSIEYWLYQEEVNPLFIYVHSYEDKEGVLRCKYCNSIIGSEMIDI